MTAAERHARFEPGPPTNPRRVNFYGHFRRGADAKRFRVNQAHAEALRIDWDRDVSMKAAK